MAGESRPEGGKHMQSPIGEAMRAGPDNNALQLTRGASVASGLRRTRHSLVPLAAERECYPDAQVR